jgi:hypothetical protein
VREKNSPTKVEYTPGLGDQIDLYIDCTDRGPLFTSLSHPQATEKWIKNNSYIQRQKQIQSKEKDSGRFCWWAPYKKKLRKTDQFNHNKVEETTQMYCKKKTCKSQTKNYNWPLSVGDSVSYLLLE